MIYEIKIPLFTEPVAFVFVYEKLPVKQNDFYSGAVLVDVINLRCSDRECIDSVLRLCSEMYRSPYESISIGPLMDDPRIPQIEQTYGKVSLQYVQAFNPC